MFIPSSLLMLVVLVVSFSPLKLGNLSFISVYHPVTVKTQKNLPPYIAYAEVQKKNKPSEWDRMKLVPSQTLTTDSVSRESREAQQLSGKVTLAAMTIEKPRELVAAPSFERVPQKRSSIQVADPEDRSWVDQLPARQKRLLEAAQNKNRVLDQNWEESSSIDGADPGSFSSSSDQGASVVIARSNPEEDTKTHSSGNSKSVHSRENPQHKDPVEEQLIHGASPPGMAVAQGGILKGIEKAASVPSGGFEIHGQLEIYKGLGVTSDNYILIRRSNEGVFQEKGAVNLQEGTYSLTTMETSGTVVAQLISEKGVVLGEGSVRLSDIQWNAKSRRQQGPKVRIFPSSEFSGTVASLYKANSELPAPPKTRIQFLNGVADLSIPSHGKIHYDSLVRGSSTLLRGEAPGFVPTQQIVISGSQFQSYLFPVKMIDSLKQMVSEQRQYNLDNPEAPVIWGQATQDGKPLAGITVELEMHDEVEVVYFNEFNLPDPNLKSTSTNGTFAFINPPLGFVSVLARRGDLQLSHQNTVIDEGTVSFVALESTLKTESTAVKVFDAFSGQALSSELALQGWPEKLQVDGQKNLLLPQVNQWSLLESRPQAGYLPATYFYNESAGYIHVPLIQENWILTLVTDLKINLNPMQSIVIGFVPESDFEVGILNQESENNQTKIYFDARGQILKSHLGSAGGGFIIFNAPPDVLEVAVHDVQSQKIISRLIPSQPGGINIVHFR